MYLGFNPSVREEVREALVGIRRRIFEGNVERTLRGLTRFSEIVQTTREWEFYADLCLVAEFCLDLSDEAMDRMRSERVGALERIEAAEKALTFEHLNQKWAARSAA